MQSVEYDLVDDEAPPGEGLENETTQNRLVHEMTQEMSEGERTSRAGTPFGYHPADHNLPTEEDYRSSEPSQWFSEEPAIQEDPAVAPHKRVAELRSGTKKSSRKRSSRKSTRRSTYDFRSRCRELRQS